MKFYRKMGKLFSIKKTTLVALVVIGMLGGGVTAYAMNTTSNSNSQLRVTLRYHRALLDGLNHIGNPIGNAVTRTLTNGSRGIRARVSFYNHWDTLEVNSNWQGGAGTLNRRLATGSEQWSNTITGTHRNGRLRARGQRMIHNESTWNTTTAGTVLQSRSWNMR